MNSLKYYDVSSCMQVIGTVFTNPSILDLEEKYKFNSEDFAQEFHNILFGSLYNLHQLGAQQISVEDIEKYLEQRPKKYAIYKLNKGSEYLENIAKMTQRAAFDYYFNRMKKMTLLRMYSKIGMDVSWLYDPDNILDVKKKEAQETWFDNTSITDIANAINDKIDNIKLKYVYNAEESTIQAGEGAIDLLNRLKETPEVGYPLYGKLVNAIHRGARLKKLYLRSASTGVGKCIPNYTILPTPNGNKKVSDIKIGDYLFDKEGKPTKVLGVYPQPCKKEVYKIYFSDGRIAECCNEHLWTVFYGKGKIQKTLSLNDIYKEVLNNGYQYTNKQYKFRIPINEPVEYSQKEYYCSPYALGAILGDGHLVDNENNHILLFSSADQEIINNLEKELNAYGIKRQGNNYNWIFRKNKNDKNSGIWTKELLKDFPELINTNSHTKFIPKKYLMGSFSQRLDLLNGLLDTDGSVDLTGRRITYVTVSYQLKEDVKNLCQSLGILVSEYKIKQAYGLQLRPKQTIRNLLFRLTRKKERILKNTTNCRQNDTIGIVNIIPTGQFVDMTCFYVDNEEHLFLMNDYIVTHNTRSMIADACYIACNKIYNLETKEWESNGTCEPTLFITTEQEEDEIQTMMIAFLSGVNEEHILNNTYVGDEWERAQEAANVLIKSPLYIKKLPDFSLQDIENTIKFHIRQFKVRYVFMDYIHSSMKILSEISSKAGVKGLREDNILFMISVRLKDLCNQYGVFIMSATQLNAEYVSAQQYDQNLLRGAKAIADKIDMGAIMLQVSEDDRESLKPVVSSMGIEMPEIKISIYKNRRGRYKDILLWCKADRGICRIDPMFVTNYNYELIHIDDLKITVKDSIKLDASAF